MIAADDVLEAEWQVAAREGGEMLNRKTGRPVRLSGVMGREGYVRYLDLGKQALEVGRRGMN